MSSYILAEMIFKDYNDGFPEKGEWQTKSDKWFSRTTTTVSQKMVNGKRSLTNDIQGLQWRFSRKGRMANKVWRMIFKDCDDKFAVKGDWQTVWQMIFKDYNDGFPEKVEWQTKSDEWYLRTTTTALPQRAAGRQSDKRQSTLKIHHKQNKPEMF
jgi:hypothetical protein